MLVSRALTATVILVQDHAFSHPQLTALSADALIQMQVKYIIVAHHFSKGEEN